ncbi:ATP-binding protein [Candidatus Poribacteria bacterium]
MSQPFEIKINLPGLLKMLGANIYAEPDVAVREMIQNAHDTCIIRKTQDKGFTAPRIDISYNKAQGTLTFSDNGAGMTEDELHGYLSTIGEGFTRVQREDLSGAGAQEALLLIGQFGIGILSAFSVSKSVEVLTRSYQQGSSGFRWICEGDIHYSVEPAEKAETGTQVVLHLTDGNLLLLDDKRLQQAIKKYADFLSVPICLKGNQINSCTPPWETEGETDYADYIKARYDLYPLAVFPFQISDPLHLDGLLFVPVIPFELTRDFGEVDVYISRMFIRANDKELLPDWARFVKGVINTTALTPTVSRDEVVRDENYATIRDMLGEIILDYLSHLEEHSPETLDLVVGAYNNTIKARSVRDDDFFDHICDLVRVSTDAGHISMKEYLSKSDGVIYYFSEGGTGTQYKLLFSHKGLPVIDASWGMEEEFLEKYAQRKGAKLERLEAGSGVIFKTLETVDEKWQDLERQFDLQVHKEARAVAFEPNTVPAALVDRPIEQDDKKLERLDALGQELGVGSSKIRQMFQKMADGKAERAAGDDTILNLNTTNPLMKQLSDMNRNETFRLALTAIYNNASMFAHHYISPENAEIIFESNNAAISAMIAGSRTLEEVQAANARMEIELSELKARTLQVSRHRSCFFAYPFQDRFHALRDEMSRILASEYDIRLTTSLEMTNSSVVESIKNHIAQAHFGIADITGNNPNVLWELGLMIGYGKSVIILKDQEDEEKTPFDLYGDYHVPYQIVSVRATGVTEYPLLASGLERNLKLIFELCPELEKAAKWGGDQKEDTL